MRFRLFRGFSSSFFLGSVRMLVIANGKINCFMEGLWFGVLRMGFLF